MEAEVAERDLSSKLSQAVANANSPTKEHETPYTNIVPSAQALRSAAKVRRFVLSKKPKKM